MALHKSIAIVTFTAMLKKKKPNSKIGTTINMDLDKLC